jgi:hypothetical protein
MYAPNAYLLVRVPSDRLGHRSARRGHGARRERRRVVDAHRARAALLDCLVVELGTLCWRARNDCWRTLVGGRRDSSTNVYRHKVVGHTAQLVRCRGGALRALSSSSGGCYVSNAVETRAFKRTNSRLEARIRLVPVARLDAGRLQRTRARRALLCRNRARFGLDKSRRAGAPAERRRASLRQADCARRREPGRKSCGRARCGCGA